MSLQNALFDIILVLTRPPDRPGAFSLHPPKKTVERTTVKTLLSLDPGLSAKSHTPPKFALPRLRLPPPALFCDSQPQQVHNWDRPVAGEYLRDVAVEQSSRGHQSERHCAKPYTSQLFQGAYKLYVKQALSDNKSRPLTLRDRTKIGRRQRCSSHGGA